MTDRAVELAARRNALRAHCEVQRSHLADMTYDIQSRLASLDRTIALIRQYAHRPLLVLGGVVLIAIIKPRRLLRWASRGAFLYASSQRLMRLVRR